MVVNKSPIKVNVVINILEIKQIKVKQIIKPVILDNNASININKSRLKDELEESHLKASNDRLFFDQRLGSQVISNHLGHGKNTLSTSKRISNDYTSNNMSIHNFNDKQYDGDENMIGKYVKNQGKEYQKLHESYQLSLF